ncbi:hypothetical protein YC2023_002370 [Brassica napus]
MEIAAAATATSFTTQRGVVTMVMRMFHIVSRLRRPMLLGFSKSRPCIHETLQQMMKTETPLKTNALAPVADFVTNCPEHHGPIVKTDSFLHSGYEFEACRKKLHVFGYLTWIWAYVLGLICIPKEMTYPWATPPLGD